MTHQKAPPDSVGGRALLGIGWTAFASWVQIALNVVTFFIIARRLDPSEFGAFGATLLVIGAGDIVLGPTLTQALEQREVLRRDHIDATFAVAAVSALAAALLVVSFAPRLAALVGVVHGAAAMQVMALALPITAMSGIPASLLSRELRFAVLGRIEVLAGIGGSLTAISVALLGGGIWALVAADLTHRTIRGSGAFVAARFLPRWPDRLKSFLELGRFNGGSFLTCGLAYLDWAVPRLLTSRILGTQAFGLYAFAQRVFEMLTQILLQPIERVVLTTIARLKGDVEGTQGTITTIYRLATLIAYPAFIGALVLAPDFVRLQGPQWAGAAPPMQILLLVGLRLSTSMFNSSILRGSGQTGGPVVIMGLGVLIQLVLVPLGAHISIAWVAAAVLVRTFATWPIGCWLIKRATGLSINQQLFAGSLPLLAACFMAIAMEATLGLALTHAAPAVRMGIGLVIGSGVYAAALMIVSGEERRLVSSAWRALRSGGGRTLAAQLWTGE